jgi:hypothetical protein
VATTTPCNIISARACAHEEAECANPRARENTDQERGDTDRASDYIYILSFVDFCFVSCIF